MTRPTPVGGARSAVGFRRWAAGLLDQQLWCWGRDIARPAGNVLLDLGMCRYRAADPKRDSTLYTTGVPGGGTVWLWGFGVLYTEPGAGGVFVRRYDFAPELTAVESGLGVHAPEQLRGRSRPVTARQRAALRTLLPRLAGWVARYENWVAETFGAGYRERCLAARGKPSPVPARDMAAAWERVAKAAKRVRPAGPDVARPWAVVLDRLRRAADIAADNRPATRGR